MKRRKGQAIVEMAIVFPFFLLIIIGGIIDFGFAFNNQLTLQQIANNTAKFAAETSADQAQITNFANSLKPKWWDGKFSVFYHSPRNLKTGGVIHKVSISYDSPAYTPFYKTMFKVTSGLDYIKLGVNVAYKSPEYLQCNEAIK